MPCLPASVSDGWPECDGELATGVLSEIVDRQTGQMARTPQLLEFAKTHGLKCITVADIVRYLDAHAIRLSS